MAGRIEVAQGYVTIVPSLKGARAKLESELGAAATSAGKSAGSKLEQGIAQGASKGARQAGEKVRDEVPKAGDAAGKEAGEKVAKGLQQPVGKASDQIAKDVQAKIGKAFSGIGNQAKSLGSSIGSAFSGVKGFWGEALADVGGQVKGSAIGQAFSGMAEGAKSAAANVLGTFKGIGGSIGGALSVAAKGVGTALGRIGSVASTAFEGIKGVATNVASHVFGAFGTIASKLKGPLSAIGGVFSTALKGVAAGAAAAAAGVTAIGKSALDAYGNFEQLQGGVRLSLGDDVWAQVEKRSQQAFSNMQISQNDYLDKVNSMATGLREALGGRGHEQEAADLADRVIKTQADIVSAMGISQEAADNAFSGIMKGNFTMLDNLALGIKPTKEGMQEVIDKMNEWNATQSDRTATNYQIDNLADCQSAIADYVEYMGLSGYAASEGSETIQGSVSKMKAAWTDWVGELGKSDANMGRVTENLTTSLGEVAGNVIPVLGNAVSAAVQQLPSLVMTVGPQLASSLVEILDTATGGMATKAIEMAQPITDALSGAFEGAMSWFGDHQGELEEIGGKFGELGGKISEALGTAIDVAGPIVEGFANAALPALSGALDLAGSAVDAAAGFIGSFGDAISPVTDALSPLVDAIGGALLDAMDKLSGALDAIDWDGWSTKVNDALQSVVDFVSARIDDLKGFFQGLGEFINDPVGTVQNKLGELVGASYGTEAAVSSSFSGMASDVQVSTAGMVGSIGNVNSTKLEGKSATFTASGNVITGTAATRVGNVNSSAANLTSKTVEYTANGNITASTSVADRIWNVVSAVSNMTSKTIDVTTNYRTTGSKGGNAMGGVVRRFANGAIFTKPTMTDVGIVGEAGAEAIYSNGRDTGIFPLTNRRYTGPFASEIAGQVARMTEDRHGGIMFNVRSTDPRAVVDEMTRRLELMGLAG